MASNHTLESNTMNIILLKLSSNGFYFIINLSIIYRDNLRLKPILREPTR
jgi:hypothetical protein